MTLNSLLQSPRHLDPSSTPYQDLKLNISHQNSTSLEEEELWIKAYKNFLQIIPFENFRLNSIDLDKFYRRVEFLSQPAVGEIIFKSKHQTFNHVNNYILDQGIIWYKPRDIFQKEWKPIYFEGEIKGIVPEEIRADGANLTVRAKNKIYYKKIIIEDNTNNIYSFKDISTENNWITNWFTLPVLSLLQNPFIDNHLTLPDDHRAWDISHRGKFCGQVEDAGNFKHLNPFTITSLYVLKGDGKTIEIFDPYVNIEARVHIHVHETSNSSYEAITLVSSCSTLFVIGYEHTDFELGGIKKILKPMTWFVDNDVLGYHPLIKYAYNVEDSDPTAFLIPMPGWKEHPIYLKNLAAVTSTLTILQTGRGNNARELRMAGWNYLGESGYYTKNIDDKEWMFIQHPHHLSRHEVLDTIKITEGEVFNTTVADYSKGILKSPALSEDREIHFSLLNFGLASLTSILCVEIDGTFVHLTLYKTKEIINFLMPEKDPVYHLIWPPKNERKNMEDILRQIFGNKKIMNVNVTQKDGEVSLQSDFFNDIKFEIHFSKG